MGKRLLLDLAGEGEVSRLEVDLWALRYLKGWRKGQGSEDNTSTERVFVSVLNKNVLHPITKFLKGEKRFFQKQCNQLDDNQVKLGSTRQIFIKIRNHKARIKWNNFFFQNYTFSLNTRNSPPPSQLLFKSFHKYPSCISTIRVYIVVCITVPHHNGCIGFKTTTRGTQNEHKYKKQCDRGPVGNKRLYNWRHMLTLKQ